MNIAGKSAFYREIHRGLKPGGWLALSEIAKGEGGELDYPTPWARNASTSILSTPEEMGDFLADAEALLAARLERVSLDDISRPAQPRSIHNTEPITMDDVIIIGGSFAGLAAALQLGRARRKVTVLDTD